MGVDWSLSTTLRNGGRVNRQLFKEVWLKGRKEGMLPGEDVRSLPKNKLKKIFLSILI